MPGADAATTRACRQKGINPTIPIAEWVQLPMWFYVAEGSGVAISIGRTLVVSSYEEVWDPGSELVSPLMWDPGSEPVPSRMRVCGIRDPNRRPLRPLCRTPSLHQAAAALKQSTFWPGLDPGSNCTSEIPMREAGAIPYDSVQILQHREYFSRESRHELIMLRLPNCAPLTAATPGLRCGKPPHHLRRCAPRDLDRMSRCAGWRRPFSPAIEGRLRLQSTRRGKCGSSRCFRDTSGEYFCPRRVAS